MMKFLQQKKFSGRETRSREEDRENRADMSHLCKAEDVTTTTWFTRFGGQEGNR